jgi:type IX secretion system PorP/SprF family membrane protein
MLLMRVTHRVYILFFGLLFHITISAQQLPQYSNYMLNNYAFNPAVGGIDPYFMAVSTNRYQWAGITDAPRTYLLSVNGPLKSMKVGLGGLLYTDIVGPTRRIGGSMSYAYHINVTEKTKLSLGLSAGITQFRVDGSKVQLSDQSDLVIMNSLQSIIKPDFGVGFHLYSAEKKWYIGGSIPQITHNKVDFVNTKNLTENRLNRHYFITGGYRFLLSEGFKLEPSTCIKYVNPVPVQYDLGLRLIYKDKMWIGAVYRTQDASSLLVGYKASSDLVFMYSYDIISSNIKHYSSGTHEFMIGLVFNRVKEKVKEED